MPELHKLTPPLAVLQGKGYKVALVTDGRMSGASGKVPAAIHVSPEALRRRAGQGARRRPIRLDAVAGTLQALVDPVAWAAREAAVIDDAAAEDNAHGLGRELFPAAQRHQRRRGRLLVDVKPMNTLDLVPMAR